MARTRLSPDRRRDQLLDLGAALFAEEPYEQVHIERVAELAGVSRGLLYHYFPSKRVFFAALVERALDTLLDATAPDPAEPPLAQLTHGVERFLRHCAADATGIRALARAAASGDEHALKLVERNRRVQEDRLLTALAPDTEPHPLLVITIRAWLAFMRTTGIEWQDHPDVPLDDVRDLCVNALVSALLRLPAAATPAGLAGLLA